MKTSTATATAMMMTMTMSTRDDKKRMRKESNENVRKRKRGKWRLKGGKRHTGCYYNIRLHWRDYSIICDSFGLRSHHRRLAIISTVAGLFDLNRTSVSDMFINKIPECLLAFALFYSRIYYFKLILNRFFCANSDIKKPIIPELQATKIQELRKIQTRRRVFKIRTRYFYT